MIGEILNSHALTLREPRTLVTDLEATRVVHQPVRVPDLPPWIIGRLARSLPAERYRDLLPTIGDAVLHILAGHTAIHLGQLKVWRRAAGLTIPAPTA